MEKVRSFKSAMAGFIGRFLMLSLPVIALLAGCKDKEDVKPEGEDSPVTFSEVFESGGIPEPVVEEEAVISADTVEESRSDGSVWRCRVERKSVVDGVEDFPLFNPNASVVYPGNLLQGATLKDGTPSVIPVKRAGGTISIDIIDGNIQPSFSVDEVKKSAIAEALNSIIAESSGVVPANFNLQVKEVHSAEHLALSLGLNVESQFVQIASQFSFRQDKSYSRFLVKLIQSFYTMSFDIPTSESDLFAPDVSPSDLEPFVFPGNPATFISDVTYGRVYYMLIESSSEAMEIESAINAAFSSAATSVDVNVEGSYLSSLDELQIKLVALGGESSSTFATFGNTDIGNLAELLGEGADIRTGVPISYVVRSVKDRQIVNVKLATEYDVKICEPLAIELENPLLWFDASDLDLASGDVQNPCTDCLEYNGFFRYNPDNDSYAYDDPSAGTAVRKWRDLTGNGYDANSVVSDPLSRPVFVDNAFNNGLPAVEFLKANFFQYTVHSQLRFSGSAFVGTDYTVFAVIAYPDKLTMEFRDGDGISKIERDNQCGYFLEGATGEATKYVRFGYQNRNMCRISHGYPNSAYTDSHQARSDFVVMAFRFSQEKGMSIFLNGEKIVSNPAAKSPPVSFEGARIWTGGDTQSYSRVRIGEIKAFGVAATDTEVEVMTKVLNKKYGI